MALQHVAEIVSALDNELAGSALADFYAVRKQARGGYQWSGSLFQIQRDCDEPRSGYAYHKGGREELQFNIGFEDDGTYFRYGVAFSLTPSRQLPDPLKVLGPQMKRFNQILALHPELAQLKMWHYDPNRSEPGAVGKIPESLQRREVFIFIGERVKVPRRGIDRAIISRAVEVLVLLLPLYQQVVVEEDSPAEPLQYRVARLCWNTEYWQRPSGPKGKSRNPGSFEFKEGYGHEEWLFDQSMLVAGKKFGFVQALNHSHARYAGERLGLLLYSINDRTKQRFWVGSIDDLHVLTREEAARAARDMGRQGWIQAMRSHVRKLGLDPESLSATGATELVNVSFDATALRVFDPPVPFPSSALPATYYGTLQQVPDSQIGIMGSETEFENLVERNLGILKTRRHVYQSTTEVDLVHKQWQEKLRKTLPKDVAGICRKVETEVDGHKLDAVLVYENLTVFVELKTQGTPRKAIRAALSQLMEYAYWPECDRCHALLIVGAFNSGLDDQAYLTFLREKFGLPVHYLQYREGHVVGIAEWLRSLSKNVSAAKISRQRASMDV